MHASSEINATCPVYTKFVVWFGRVPADSVGKETTTNSVWPLENILCEASCKYGTERSIDGRNIVGHTSVRFDYAKNAGSHTKNLSTEVKCRSIFLSTPSTYQVWLSRSNASSKYKDADAAKMSRALCSAATVCGIITDDLERVITCCQHSR